MWSCAVSTLSSMSTPAVGRGDGHDGGGVDGRGEVCGRGEGSGVTEVGRVGDTATPGGACLKTEDCQPTFGGVRDANG